MPTETKPWWQSKTVWGSIIALVAGAATFVGLNLDAALQDQLSDLFVGFASLIGGALAWYGRAKATTTLTK